jgi:glyoxylase-like metal-dependent hydrolase (beta-lactamase superfamily II)
MPRSGISPPRALAAWRSLRPVWHTLQVIFQQILNEESGCLSYLIGCSQAGQAAIVDPARDRVDDYVAMARRKGLTVSAILETHVHADHVSGNQALAGKTGARIHIHAAANAAFPTTRWSTAGRSGSATWRCRCCTCPATPRTASQCS